MGKALEELYGDQVDEIAVQLAYHFEEAGLEEKARHYLYQAGEQARRQYAHEEAVAYLSRALELTPEMDYAERYAILSARERAYDVQGEREAQRGDLAILKELAEALEDPSTGLYTICTLPTRVAVDTDQDLAYPTSWEGRSRLSTG